MRHLLSLLMVTALHSAEPQLVAPQQDKVLLLDSRVVMQAINAKLVLGHPEKAAENPLLPSDLPWENATNNYYPNVIWDQQEKLWKLWYKDVLADAAVIAKMEKPSTVHDVGWYLLFATSKDGLRWQRPALGLHSFDGSTANNIVARDCPNVGVFKDLHDPSPSRRYKMVHDVGLGKPRVRFSHDGLHWGAAQEAFGFSTQQGDTHNNAFFDERSQKYLWFTKMYLGERLVSRLESEDFLHWKSSGIVLRSALEEGRSRQTYALTVFPYANLYLGYLMMYHVGHGRLVDVELAWSHDSIHWQRVAPGQPFLPLGDKPSYDSGCIYAQAGPAVSVDGQLMLYYGGSPTVHLGWKRSASLCLARLREDGFAGYEAIHSASPATLITQPLTSSGKPITVSADGGVTFERLPGTEADTFRLKLTLTAGARLYAISGVRLVHEELPPPPEIDIPQLPVQRPALHFDFTTDAQGWAGVDTAAHQPEGYLRISRSQNRRPIAHAQPAPGDWPTLLGGAGLEISARLRSPHEASPLRLEIFARDVSQWTFEKLPPLSKDWQEVKTQIRFDWTDEQAKAAGWSPTIQAYPWRQTMRHVGKIVIMPTSTGSTTFDLDDVRLLPLPLR